jgi:hypothetical protein
MPDTIKTLFTLFKRITESFTSIARCSKKRKPAAKIAAGSETLDILAQITEAREVFQEL